VCIFFGEDVVALQKCYLHGAVFTQSVSPKKTLIIRLATLAPPNHPESGKLVTATAAAAAAAAG
jgi:hypothetical protein